MLSLTDKSSPRKVKIPMKGTTKKIKASEIAMIAVKQRLKELTPQKSAGDVESSVERPNSPV